LPIELPRRSNGPPLVHRFAGYGPRLTEFLEDYDLGVVEHFGCAPYLDQIAPHCRHTVLNLHNIESAWHRGCAKVASWPHSLAHKIFERAALDMERRWLPRYSLLLTASAADAARVKQIAPQTQVAVYPNSIPLLEYPRRAEQDLLVFSGMLDYEPNRTAVRYFAAKIWPLLRRAWPNLKWRVVGTNPQAIERYLRDDPRIECTGRVNDAIVHLSAAKVAVVPVLSGSGTRLKIIEAWAAGTPVVSTSIGAEGLPARNAENILLADSPESFVAAVTLLLQSTIERQRIGLAGRRQYEQEFTWNQAWTALDRQLGQLCI
jgi:glycosyltransferase involved in cell wall biosynthesis